MERSFADTRDGVARATGANPPRCDPLIPLRRPPIGGAVGQASASRSRRPRVATAAEKGGDWDAVGAREPGDLASTPSLTMKRRRQPVAGGKGFDLFLRFTS